MKHLTTISALILFAFIGLSTVSCGSSGGDTDNHEHVEGDGHDHDGHDHSADDHAGHNHDDHAGHDHGDDAHAHSKEGDHEHITVYYCPMMCEGDKTYDKEGKCPECKMDLKGKLAHADGSKHDHTHD